MFCIQCGAQNVEGASTCAKCAASLAATPGNQTVVQGANTTMVQPPVFDPTYQAPAIVSGLAIASLVLGLLGFFSAGLTGIAGLILGILALRQIGASNGRITGQGLAIAGLVSSAVTIMILPIMLAILLPVFSQARERAREASCMSNLKQLSVAGLMYSQDYDQHFPPRQNWAEGLLPYTKNQALLRCPSVQTQDPPTAKHSDYAYNSKMSHVVVSDVKDPFEVPMLFDSQSGWDLSGGLELVAPRHRSGANVAFVDGHVKRMVSPMLGQMIWNPGQAVSTTDPMGIMRGE